MANKTYVELVNSAIQESGADLASYSVTGSDFTTNTDSLMRRFKVWVQRAWLTLQQDADDWQFLTSRAVVNVGPRIMFYVEGAIPGAISHSVDVYDSSDSVKIPGLAISDMVDLTDGYSSETPSKSYGYLTIDEASYPVGFTLKPGNDYFYLQDRITTVTVAPGGTFKFFQHGAFVGQRLSIVMAPMVGAAPGVTINDVATLTSLTPLANDDTLGTQEFKFTTLDPAVAAMIATNDYKIAVYNTPQAPWDAMAGYPPNSLAEFNSDPFGGTVTVNTNTPAKAYVHSWGSYDWNEELAANDFTDHVKKVNSATYKIIRTSSPDAGTGTDLVCAPWHQFMERVEGSGYAAADPAFISEDSQGRWRLWPAPKERVTITFDYARLPQALTAYNDIPQHLDAEYEDLIVWKALITYGEFSEQPGVVRRAVKEYMNIKYRFEKNKRPVFNFQPAGFGRR